MNRRPKVLVAQKIAKEGVDRLEQAGFEVVYSSKPVRMAVGAADEIVNVLSGGEPINCVNRNHLKAAQKQ